MGLITDIIKRIVGTGDKRLFVTENRDCFILRHQDAIEEEYGAECRVFSGSSLDLRLVREYEMTHDTTSKFIFIPTEDFTLLDDIAEDCERVTINVQRFFSRYHWQTIKDLSLSELEWLYSQKQIVPLNAVQTACMLNDYHSSPDYRQQAIQNIKHEWNRLTTKVNFKNASEFMPQLSSVMVNALSLEAFNTLTDGIQNLNEQFQVFLKDQFEFLVSSGVNASRPKIVSRIAPFISRQDETGRYALIVVDGMNLWQAMILASSIEDSSRNITIKYETTFAWLPSVTELSRQAIFTGGTPSIHYNQNPYTEQKLWEQFWISRRIPSPYIYYQHNGELTPNANSTRIGYVNTELDDMMHGALNYNYLYEDTLRWVRESSIVNDVIRLGERGYKVFLTSDHGSIESVPYRTLAQSDKTGARWDRRYITLSEHADADRFEEDYKGHIHKLSETSRTYYAKDREIFSSQSGVVTH